MSVSWNIPDAGPKCCLVTERYSVAVLQSVIDDLTEAARPDFLQVR